MTTSDLPIAQVRRLLCKQISQLSQKERQEILNFALSEIPGKKFVKSGGGTMLSLDSSIPDEVIQKMHVLVQSKLIFYDPADFKQ